MLLEHPSVLPRPCKLQTSMNLTDQALLRSSASPGIVDVALPHHLVALLTNVFIAISLTAQQPDQAMLS